MRFHLSEYFRTVKVARKARRAGDIVSAERWMRYAERQLRLAVLFEETLDEQDRRALIGIEASKQSADDEEKRNAAKLKLLEFEKRRKRTALTNA